MRIGKRSIGKNQSVFIIAEAGVNHNGRLDIAKKLVDVAKIAGADAIKFQTFKAENLVTNNAEMADYQIENTKEKKSQFDMLKNLELAYDDFKVLKKYCDQKEIIFLSTPHTFDAIDFLDDLVPAYKIGSGDLTNSPALKIIAKKGKPVILGTGMSTLHEVKLAIDAIKSQGNEQIIIMHCTTNYPSTPEEVNLRAMVTMQKEFDIVVGYSDHTLGTMTAAIATALGAKVIEKHFTLDKNLPGPDHKASIEPDELTKMIKEIRSVEKILGNSTKEPTESEKKIMKLVRKSIVAGQDIDKGSVINENMIVIKRPGTGVSPTNLHKIVGKKAKKNILKDKIFQLDMVE